MIPDKERRILTGEKRDSRPVKMDVVAEYIRGLEAKLSGEAEYIRGLEAKLSREAEYIRELEAKLYPAETLARTVLDQ